MAKKQTESQKKQERQTVLKAKLGNWFSEAESVHKKNSWKWFTYDLWVDGKHYATFDRKNEQIQTQPINTGRPQVVINKVYSTIRGVRNFVLRNKPRADVVPAEVTRETLGEAIGLTKYLSYIHENLRLRPKLKASVWDALKYSVGYWQILWDKNLDEGKGGIVVNDIDPYDLMWESSARQPSEARYAILAIRRNIDDLKSDPKYDQDEVAKLQTDGKLAQSTEKSQLLQSRGEVTNFNSGKSNTIIIKEFWWKETKIVGKGDKAIEKLVIKVATMANGIIIRDEEETRLDRIPFFRLQADVNPRSMVGQGWVKNLIPINRELDRLVSQIAEYNLLMNRGKWISEKGAGVRIVNNQQGQILEHKRGFSLRHVPIAPLSNAVFNAEAQMNRYMEDLGGLGEASAGRVPTGITSGRALEILQVGDANNMSELIENVELFLEEAYEYILFLASQHYQFARNIFPVTTTGQREIVSIIGSEAPSVDKDGGPEGAVVIQPKNIVDVHMTSFLASTVEARQEKAKELFQLGLIDDATALEFFNIGNVADVIQRVSAKKEETQVEEIAQQGAEAEVVANANPEGATPESGVEQATAAIRQILQGQEPVIPESISPEFTQFIDQFISSEEVASLPQEVQAALQQFRDNVVQTAGRA